MSDAHSTASATAAGAPVVPSTDAVFSVPVVITRPRYVLSGIGRGYVDQAIAAAAGGGATEQWYARILTAWRDTLAWCSGAPESYGPPPGITAADMDPADDRLRRLPEMQDAQATMRLRNRDPETIADPYRRMLVRMVQACEPGEEAASRQRMVRGTGGLIPLSTLRPESTYLTMPQMRARFAELGYTIGRDHCDCIARMMTGPCAGMSYEARTLSVHEADTGRSAFHVDARRDASFTRMQELRMEVYSLVQHRLIEV